MTDVVKNSKGEALAIRALAHFNLLYYLWNTLFER